MITLCLNSRSEYRLVTLKSRGNNTLVSPKGNCSGHSTMSRGKDMNGAPKSVYDVSFVRNTGWPTGGDAYGHRVLVVVGGVTPSQGDGKAVRRAKQDR